MTPHWWLKMKRSKKTLYRKLKQRVQKLVYCSISRKQKIMSTIILDQIEVDGENVESVKDFNFL